MKDKANKLNFASSDRTSIVEVAMEEWNNAPESRTAGVNFGHRAQTAMDNGEAWAISFARMGCAATGRKVMSDLVKSWAQAPVQVGGAASPGGSTSDTPASPTATAKWPPSRAGKLRLEGVLE